MLDYPLVSIAYCVRCKWMLRSAWYMQEILQTFCTTQDSTVDGLPKLAVNSVLLKPSLVAGTFTIAVKVKKGESWTVIWDRKMDGGFPDSKTVKQKIRDLVKPGMNMRHVDHADSGNGALLQHSLTEECLECTRTWEG